MNRIYVAESGITGAGRGVYAKDEIAKGELIERCPLIRLSGFETEQLNESSLMFYMFYCGEGKNEAVIALGFGSIYNHAERANARYEIKNEEKVMEFVALKKIKKDEEIFFDYKQGNSENRFPLWFEVSIEISCADRP